LISLKFCLDVSRTAPVEADSKPAASTSITAPPPAAKTIGPSKMLAAATVRLYKVNPTTRAYDAVENGGFLGCVLMGTGLTFQFLIYNAQVS
jgi:hypothetical protein